MKKNKFIVGVLLVYLTVFILSCTQKNTVCSDNCQEKNEIKKSEKKVFIMNNQTSANLSEQLVCKLKGTEFIEKKELLKTEIFSQVKETDEVHNGYILYFKDKGNILLKLTDYLMIEKECCPFFVFDLNIQPNSEGISLKISGQEGVKEMLKPLINEITRKK